MLETWPLATALLAVAVGTFENVEPAVRRSTWRRSWSPGSESDTVAFKTIVSVVSGPPTAICVPLGYVCKGVTGAIGACGTATLKSGAVSRPVTKSAHTLQRLVWSQVRAQEDRAGGPLRLGHQHVERPRGAANRRRRLNPHPVRRDDHIADARGEAGAGVAGRHHGPRAVGHDDEGVEARRELDVERVAGAGVH